MSSESSDPKVLGTIVTGHTKDGNVVLMIPAKFLGYAVVKVESARSLAESILRAADEADKAKRENAERN